MPSLVQFPARVIRADFNPDFPVELNRRSTLTQSIVTKLHMGRAITGVAANQIYTPTFTGTGARFSDIHGREWGTTDNNSSVVIPINQDWSLYQEFTIAIYAKISAWGLNYARLIDKSSSASNSQVAIYRQSGTTSCVLNASTRYSQFKSGSINAIADGKYHAIVWTYSVSNNQSKMYIDGVLYDTQTQNSAFVSRSGTNSLYLAQSINYPTQVGTTAQFVDFNFIGRVWNAAQAREYSLNPFSMLRPINDSIWIPVSSGGGGTVTFSVSGGLTLAGAVQEIYGKVFGASGGLQSGGANLPENGKVFQASGGTTTGGSGTQANGKVFSTSGGLTLGTAVSWVTHIASVIFTVGGGLVIGSAVTWITKHAGLSNSLLTLFRRRKRK